MPLKVKTLSSIILFIFTFALVGLAQNMTPVNAPSSAEIMRERVAKAKAYIVVKNYNAAIYELENIRNESAYDPTLDSVINVLLMNSFLEQGDYRRAQEFLTNLSKEQKANKPNAAANYFAVAAQVIKSARIQLERYHSMGLNVSDRTLPEAASADVERMRLTLELVVEQSKDFGKDKKYTDTAMALLEGATTARGNLAKDDYDANRWRIEVSDAREELTNSRSTILNAENMPAGGENNNVAVNTPAEMKENRNPSVLLPVSKDTPSSDKKTVNNKPSNEIIAKTDKPNEKPSADPPKEEAKKPAETANDPAAEKRNRVVVRSAPKNEPGQDEKKAETETAGKQTDEPKNDSPLEVGSLIGYATKKTNPIYPQVARNMRMTGVVKVEVLLDEEGKVAQVQNTDGPTLLKSAAQDAIRKWKFTPFKRDGEPVKATGFVSFNFSL